MLEQDIEALNGEKPEDNGEARREPQVWGDVARLVAEAREDIDALVARAKEAAAPDNLTVVLTGDGAALNAAIGSCGQLATGEAEGMAFAAVDAERLADAPLTYVPQAGAALLVALSAVPSDRLVKAVNAVKAEAGRFFCLALACTPDDPLAEALTDDDDAFMLTLPVEGDAADRKDAARSADLDGFGALQLATLLALDAATERQRESRVSDVRELGEQVTQRGAAVGDLEDLAFERVVFLADGLAGGGAAREAARQARARGVDAAFGDLKGAALDPSRTHDALALVFVPSEPTDDREEALADLARLSENAAENGCTPVAVQQDEAPRWEGPAFTFDGCACLPAGYLALPYLMVAQQVGVLAAGK